MKPGSRKQPTCVLRKSSSTRRTRSVSSGMRGGERQRETNGSVAGMGCITSLTPDLLPTPELRRHRRALLPAITALFLVAVACGSESDNSGLSKLGDPLVLSVGGTIEVDTGSENVLVQFLSLDGDSRCPSGVQCTECTQETTCLRQFHLLASPLPIPNPNNLQLNLVLTCMLVVTGMLETHPSSGTTKGDRSQEHETNSRGGPTIGVS